MSGVLGIGIWVLLIAAAILVGLAVLMFGLRAKRRRDGQDAVTATALGGSRLTMLESTEIDVARRLLLVRCDDVEHLIMVGGPVDLVVENDVRKSRAAKNALKPVAEIAPRRPVSPAPEAAELSAPLPASQPAALQPPRPDDAKRQRPRPEVAERPSRPALTAVPLPLKNGQSGVAPVIRPGAAADEPPRAPLVATPRRADPPAAPTSSEPAPAPQAAEPPPAPVQPVPEKTRPRIVERLLGRRDPVPPAPPSPQVPAAPTADAQPKETRRRPAASANADVAAEDNSRAGRDSAANSREPRRPALVAPVGGAVGTSWAEPDSLEGEIVRALSVKEDQAPAAPPPGAPLPNPAVAAAAAKVAAAPASPKAGDVKAGARPATTLGDLAERLEEALAREVKAANQNRSRADVDLDGFEFETDAPSRGGRAPESAPAPVRAKAEREPPEPDKPAPQKAVVPATDPERRDLRMQAERQEEAPVISLNARRREVADPLEDEMARLLGELTGDTTRR